jgi:hypothetical protein
MKLILITALFSLPLFSYSQAFKFKAFQTYWKPATQTRPIREDDWNDADILVVINIDKYKVKTFGRKQGDYDIIKLYDPVINDNGDKVLPLDAVDEDGDKCSILLTIFKDQSNPHVATLGVFYSYGSLNFRLKKDE